MHSEPVGPRTPAQNHRRGFSLVEACTAIVILMMGVLGSVQLYFHGLDKLNAYKEAELAARIADNEVEFLRSLHYDDLLPGEDRPIVATDLSGTGLANAVGVVRVTDCDGFGGGLRQIEVSLRWTGENGRTIERRVTTRVAELGARR